MSMTEHGKVAKLASIAVLAVAWTFARGSGVQADEVRPNIVVILSDDQGWADIGFNNPAVYTPNLDRLAGEGLIFANHYVMPQCTPTRVALMTGRYPSRFGGAAMTASNEPALPHGTPTVASMLQAAGYQTFLCGKWHLGSTAQDGPGHFGFDHSYGSLAGAVGMYDHRYRKGKFSETWHRDHKLIEGRENGTHATDLITAEAIRIVKTKHDKPFFLYIPFHSVHTPLDERGEFVDQPTRLDPDRPGRWINEDRISWFNDPAGKIQGEPDPEKRLLLAAAYHLDDSIGRIIAALEESGQRKNTLILFSSDNGPQGNWPGNAYPDDLKLTDFNQPLPMRGIKLDVWEGGIHVPAFANWPGKIRTGVNRGLVHIIDWFPTLATIANCQPAIATEWDGIDLAEMMLNGKSAPERDLYFTWSNNINRWALRSGDWKIVKYGVGEPVRDDWQLFDLDSDPREQIDVASTNPDVVERLHGRFEQQRLKDKSSEQDVFFNVTGKK